MTTTAPTDSMAPARPVVTRFAPSPTGFLHIGGARTALYSWLYARHTGGRYLLRIEDTDRQRSTPEAVQAILDGLGWLGLLGDEPPTMQFERAGRHAEVAREMVARGNAYYCYASPEELAQLRAEQEAAKLPIRYDGRWRDRDPSEAPAGVAPVIRLRANHDGETTIHDRVQGPVTVPNSQIDDLILLRSDGTPTYMLSVVVDDWDMGVTHVIRGDDHLTNAFRQHQIYAAMDWETPVFAHVPMILGEDGAKLSKRNGAPGVDAYRDMGYLPEALRNYLLRLGWGHGDAELLTEAEQVALFTLEGIGRSPSRLDSKKLGSYNAHYLRATDDAVLAQAVAGYLAPNLQQPVDEAALALLARAMPGLKERAQTLVQLAEGAAFYLQPLPLSYNDKAQALLAEAGPALLRDIARLLAEAPDWEATALETRLREHGEAAGLKLGKLAQPLRAALTGSNASPPIFEVAEILGRAQVAARLEDAALRAEKATA